MISSPQDLDRCREELDTMTDDQLLDEAALYDHLADEACMYENWYATDLYTDAASMYRGEYYDRVTRRVAHEAAAKRRHQKQLSTIGNRIPDDVRNKLLALKAAL